MDPSEDATSNLSFVPYKTINTYADVGCVGNTVRFDPYEELLWVGANEGFLHSYQGPYLAQYSGFNTLYGGTLTDFCLTDAGPFVLTTNGMTLHKRDGTTLFSPIISSADSFNCCLAVDKSSTFTAPGTVIVAGNKGVAKKLDMNRPDEPEHLQIADLDSVFLRASDRFLCFGSADGEVGIKDLRSNHFRKHRIKQKEGVLYDFDVHDYSLFSCIYETDIHGTILPSCSIFAYDLRVCKPTSPIIASLSPTLIRFLPNSCGQTCVVADSDGRYQFVDSVATSSSFGASGATNSHFGAGKNVYQIDGITAVPFSLDVSPSTQGIAVADTAGFVHVLSAANAKKPLSWNNFSRPSADFEVIHQTASNDMLLQPNQRFVNSFAIGTVPYNNRKALTTGFSKSSEVKKQAVVHRSASYVDCSSSGSTGIFASAHSASPHKSYEFLALDGTPNKMVASNWEEAPVSPLAVLEPIPLYRHINPVLQGLFSMKSVSAFYQSHVCFDEFCLTCELGFLFHMMSVQGSEDSCQATNLVRVLRALPEAAERGLISTGHDDLNVGLAVHNWMEFLLERTHNEYLHHTGYHESQESPVTQLCAWKVLETVMHECGHVNQLEKFVFCLSLQYCIPHEGIGQDLHCVLRTTLNEHSEWMLTCAYCHQQNNSYVSRNILSCPESFALSFNLEDSSNKAALKHLLDSWSIRQVLSREKSKSPLTSEVKPCRYGASCTRPNCFFLHPREVEAEQDAIDSPTFIPPYLWARIDLQGQAEIVSQEPADSHTWSCYEAVTLSYENVAYGKDAKPTVTCVVKVPNSTTEPIWQCMDDVSASTLTQHAALTFDLNYKVPCLIQYAQIDMEQRWPTRVVNPITREIFQKFCDLTASRRSYQTSSVVAAQRNEIFNNDTLVALDAEFVSLQPDNLEVDLPSDVTANSVKPSLNLSVGRVTALRGNGPLTDTLLMDEFVVARDKVANHLTEFSGIRPGDLSANLSLKRLDTLKSVYVRLRYLVDAGVRFIGHGIHTDFKILNIRVPVDQIIDTVQLYRIPGQRLISLKFLSWYFLGNHIQHLHGHDSAEDALTALRLFNLYEKYQTMSYTDNSNVTGCTFVDLLAQMYELGRSLQWKVPPQSP